MPIYLDRHDVPEAITPEEVARIHQQDLQIQHKFGCKALTYWFDSNRNIAFCLIDSVPFSASFRFCFAANTLAFGYGVPVITAPFGTFTLWQ